MTDQPRYTVLVIDDEPLILTSLRRLLRREFEVLTANSGLEGLALMRAHEVQIVISDQRMPTMTGDQVLTQARGEFPDAIRLLLTGYADLESVISAINSGQIYRYLVKPWNPDELLAVLREACEKYELIVQNRRLTRELLAANAELERRVEERTAALATANDQLRELNRLKDELLSIASHDLRSPLGNIQMMAQLLIAEGLPLSDEQRHDYTRRIYEAARHLIALVSDMLDLAKIESGQVQLDRTELLISDVARRSIDALAFNASAKRIGVQFMVAPEEPTVCADQLKLYQLFNNLLSNAIKFTPDDGHVAICVSPEPGGVRVSVADTGVGIAPEALPRLFEKFTPSHSRGTAGEKGSGLGLAIVRQLVDLHGGRIEAASEPGRGSTFTVHLPRLH